MLKYPSGSPLGYLLGCGYFALRQHHNTVLCGKKTVLCGKIRRSESCSHYGFDSMHSVLCLDKYDGRLTLEYLVGNLH